MSPTFSELKDLYSELSDFLATQHMAAVQSKESGTAEICNQKKIHNDQAYFLYLFTRLEGRINEKVQKQKPELKEAHFMEKVRWIFPQNSQVETRTRKYLEKRNSIGHGGNFNQVISMRVVVPQIEHLFNSIKL
ncbi:hypothetical protein SAMN04488518_107125 [Pseudovibrio ascidiaceicola]|uniref:RiboL-PSP-HEPN domain-containing protein n=1 Tax=Pseudovibrio ascidiaceicola TaxID=285279 RepID=A0A1I4B6N1_9HYPH|nr:hypothetical protein [Pseudovibrio ascidiaceicola]SFK63569.1 hypothetical protein SAMN04488518_107125 [Pseudovibrio ascidiaceicola]